MGVGGGGGGGGGGKDRNTEILQFSNLFVCTFWMSFEYWCIYNNNKNKVHFCIILILFLQTLTEFNNKTFFPQKRYKNSWAR